MSELEYIRYFVLPQEIVLVLDSMMGQNAVSVVKKFDDALGVSSVILTKMDIYTYNLYVYMCIHTHEHI